MGRRRGGRRLLVGDDVYLLAVGHRHTRTEGGEGRAARTDGCREVVSLARLDGRRRVGALMVVFHQGPGRLVADGYLHDGAVLRAADDVYLNLHRPAVARALLDEAVARGWDRASALELDGWELLDGVVARLADAGAAAVGPSSYRAAADDGTDGGGEAV